MQLAHQLACDLNIADLAAERSTEVLMAAARDMKASTDCIALHSLKSIQGKGLFAPGGRMPLPCSATIKPRKANWASNTAAAAATQVKALPVPAATRWDRCTYCIPH